MIQETDFHNWDNNVNTITQKDAGGNIHNIAYIDADDGMQFGPNDPRITALMQVPLNLFRPHVVSDFDERTLDPKWDSSFTGSSYTALSSSELVLHTGATNGSSIEVSMPNVPMYFVAGQKVYFYLRTPVNGNLDLEFGIKKDANNLIRFKRVEDDVAQQYASQCMSGGVIDSLSSVGVGDSVRRIFCIEVVAGAVKFYVGTDMGKLELKSTHTINIPTGTGKVYAKFSNRYPTDRTVNIDIIYTVRIR